MAERITLPNTQQGIVREAAVDSFISPKESCELALNVHFDRVGAIQARGGQTRLGNAMSASPVLGMGNYRNNAGTVYAALAKADSNVYANTGSGWSSARDGLTATSKARFTNLVDYVFMVNGNANEGCATWNGSGVFGGTNVADLPAGDYIENFRNRIWVMDKSDDKLYYTDVVNTDGTISGGSEYIQISPADGENATGLMRTARSLLVFKQNHIYRVYSINSTDPDPAINRGTYSQESIVEAKDGIYYHHSSGFYKYTDGGEQQEISRPIIDVIQAIPRSSYENVAGWADDDHVLWSIGDITLSGVALQNVICRYTISTQVWTLYSTATQIRSSALYDSGTTLFTLLGDESGSALKHDTGTDDFGTPIYYELVTHWMGLTDVKSLSKTFTQASVTHENAEGANVQFQVDTQNQRNTNNSWTPMGVVNEPLYSLLSADAQSFTRIRFRISGNCSGTTPIFRGIEILDLIVNGIQQHA